jgi:uncharacterized domain HDIG
MRRILVNTIKGNEILARDIINNRGIVIITAGNQLKKQYIKRLLELDIMYVYIEDELSKGVESENNIEIKIMEQCQKITKEIIEKYSYQGYGDLEELQYVAEDIINDVIKQPEVLYNVIGIRNKSESTYSHSINVCALSVLLALRLKLSKVRVRDIAVGSLLHDIGYTALPSDYLNLSYNNSQEEQKELMKHVIYGYEIVSKESWLTNVSKDIILCHHEKMDGSGFPFHINKDKIKVGSKIVALCDDFDSMVYGYLVKRMKVHDVLNYIISQAGVKYDFACVNYFIESIAAYPNGTVVATNEGETGIVLRQNEKCPTRPVLHMITNSRGEKYNTWVEKDLKKELTLFIRDTIE